MSDYAIRPQGGRLFERGVYPLSTFPNPEKASPPRRNVTWWGIPEFGETAFIHDKNPKSPKPQGPASQCVWGGPPWNFPPLYMVSLR